jgi:hypothetical protein
MPPVTISSAAPTSIHQLAQKLQEVEQHLGQAKTAASAWQNYAQSLVAEHTKLEAQLWEATVSTADRGSKIQLDGHSDLLVQKLPMFGIQQFRSFQERYAHAVYVLLSLN